MMRADQAGWTWIFGGSRRLGGSSGTPTAGGFPVSAGNPSDGPEQLRAQPRHAEDARAGVRADDRADLRHHRGVAPVDRPAALGEPLGLAGRLHVLHGERVAAVLAPLLEVGDEALERPAGGAHALDRLHLALDGETRLDLQRRADPRPGPADPPAAAQVLERV